MTTILLFLRYGRDGVLTHVKTHAFSRITSPQLHGDEWNNKRSVKHQEIFEDVVKLFFLLLFFVTPREGIRDRGSYVSIHQRSDHLVVWTLVCGGEGICHQCEQKKKREKTYKMEVPLVHTHLTKKKGNKFVVRDVRPGV